MLRHVSDTDFVQAGHRTLYVYVGIRRCQLGNKRANLLFSQNYPYFVVGISSIIAGVQGY